MIHRIPGNRFDRREARAMQFIVVTRRRTDRFTDAQFAEVLGPEAERARALYAEGAFRAIYSRGDIPGAVLVLEAPGPEEAAALMGSLPFAQREMMEYEIIPIKPYHGFLRA